MPALVVMILLSALGVLAAPTPARAAAGPEPAACRSAGLAEAKVAASARLEHDDRTHTKITTELSVDVPGDWPLAQDLLLGETSGRYITAMSCLTMNEAGQQRRWRSWRTGSPTVVSKDGRVKVVDRVHSWVNRYREYIDVGPWRVRAGAERWTVTLRPPPALAGARWEKVTVDPGAPGAETATPRPTTGEGVSALVWRPEAPKKPQPAKGRNAPEEKPAQKAAAGTAPSVTVSLRPPWQRSWAAQNDRLVAVGLDRLGRLLWTGAVSALLLVAARRYRHRGGVPTAQQHRTLGNLVAWAPAVVLLDVFIFADDLVVRYAERTGDGYWGDERILLGHCLALAAASVLLGFAKPSGRLWAAAAVLALPPLVVMMWPAEFGLFRPEADPMALATLAIVSCCMLALLLLGCAAAAWRLAVDGGLLPESRRHPGSQRVMRLRWAGPAVGAAVAAIGVSFAVAEERSWRRVSWLSDRTENAYGLGHRNDWYWELTWSVNHAPEWILDYSWLLTCVAALAVLRTWRAPSSLSPFEDAADRLLFLNFYAFGVALIVGYYVSSSLLTVLSIPLSMLALFGVASMAAPRAVLAQPFERSAQPLAAVRGPATRRALLRKSRAYRETHAELRRLDQGLFGDVPPKRKNLERELSDLHDWPTGVGGSSAGPDRLPAKVSVVDATLALGPRDDWWANGTRGARFAVVCGLPAAVLATWAWGVRGEAWQDTLSYLYGLPDLLLNFLTWTATWAAAGFVLGALWRMLPGRRGAAKALPVAVAFALPLGLDFVGIRFAREGSANLPLYMSLMLFVLTVTGIALDLDTFQGERRYWQSRLGLLLSVYQMRYYSLQLAYLIAQIVAMITVWEFLTEPDASPTKELTGVGR
ncbi:DUF6185 family protein [Streptomyces sp. NPDC006551]|uniref:DUF6185 family protein n=1 Tax=Streptomyces sp. NPDC006551 TaxID=3157178 RepID=UPI0033AD1DE9